MQCKPSWFLNSSCIMQSCFKKRRVSSSGRDEDDTKATEMRKDIIEDLVVTAEAVVVLEVEAEAGRDFVAKGIENIEIGVEIGGNEKGVQISIVIAVL